MTPTLSLHHLLDVKLKFHRYWKEHKDRFIKDFQTFLSFKTVSAEYDVHKNDFSSCIEWLTLRLERIGFSISLFDENPTSGKKCPPVIIAKLSPDFYSFSDAPTVTFYNHYDVQPAEFTAEWFSDPFSPYIDDSGIIWGRGAQDNKGQLFFVLAALEALFYTSEPNLPPYPVNIQLLIEGEEESGSELLSHILSSLQDESLRSDYTMIVDTAMQSSTLPAITFGSRGLVAATISIQGTNSDLHSGIHGGVAKNPLHAMVELLSSLQDPHTGKVMIDHFYDDVIMPLPEETQQLHHMDPQCWQQEYGQKPAGGEKEYSITERAWLRPTLEINGIHGGYGGAGCKTVIPKEAIAKITCRLVPNQDPTHIGQLITHALRQKAIEGVTIHVDIHEGTGSALRCNMSSHLAKTLTDVMQHVWGVKPCYVLTGCSIPVISFLARRLGGELVLWGVGLNSDDIHAPNEHFSIDRMEKGFITTCLIVEKLRHNRVE